VAAGTVAAAQEPRPVPLTSPVREVRRGDERLRGVEAVDVLIASFKGAVDRCRIMREDLQRDAKQTLIGGGVPATISERSSSWFYTIAVTVHTAAAGDRCVTALGTELMTHVEGIPEVDRYATAGTWGSLLVGQLSLIDLSDLIESAAAEHATVVRSALREQLAAIARRIVAANE
jgi:hypothetical protein